MQRKIYSFAAVFILCLLLSTTVTAQSSKPADIIKSGGTIKILHIMSFGSPWEWTDKQFEGFKEQLKDIKVEYKVAIMDFKMKSKEENNKFIEDTIDLIKNWKPDLVYTTDDAAQVITKPFINLASPYFVFSGINKTPQFYNYMGSKNVIGVLEIEHFVPTVRMMQKILPKMSKLAIISDSDDANWTDVYGRINEKAAKELPDVKVVELLKFKTFADYKAKLLEYNRTKAVDAIFIVGWFRFTDENGKIVAEKDVARWTVENSNTPEMSFWQNRVALGNLCSYTVSGLEQGRAAGKLAREILVEGKEPSSLQFVPTAKGKPEINLRRAQKLGLTIPNEVLLMVEKPIQSYLWD